MRLYRVSTPVEVLRLIRENFRVIDTEVIALEQAGGRVTGEDITASEDVPGFDRSTVDGYAVRAADTFGAGETIPAMLRLAGEVLMGEEAPGLPPESCIYIPTGGMLPPGADAVVMIEDTETIGDLVNCSRQAAPGENVIARGEDVAGGDVVIQGGRRLRAPELGVLASLGISSLRVVKKPRVGIISTGNEIVPYTEEKLRPGQIRDSNALAVGHLALQRGAEAIYGGILQDSFDEFSRGVEKLLRQVDFLVLSGGSSVGTRDFSEKVLRRLSGGDLLVEGVAVQPGKPTLMASCQGKPVLGLPGHPVSALNIFSVFGSYIIDTLLGIKDEGYIPTVKARLTRNIPSSIGRTDYIRVRLERNEGRVEAVPVFGRSGLLRTLASASGVVLVSSSSEGLLAGTEVEVIIWE